MEAVKQHSAWCQALEPIISSSAIRGSRQVKYHWNVGNHCECTKRLARKQVQRERDGKMMDLTSGTPWETVKLTTLSRDRRYFPALLGEAQQLAKASQVGKMIIYTAWGPEWRPFGQPRAKRLLESVILDTGIKERIVSDIQQFMSRGKWYAERGRSIASRLDNINCY